MIGKLALNSARAYARINLLGVSHSAPINETPKLVIETKPKKIYSERHVSMLLGMPLEPLAKKFPDVVAVAKAIDSGITCGSPIDRPGNVTQSRLFSGLSLSHKFSLTSKDPRISSIAEQLSPLWRFGLKDDINSSEDYKQLNNGISKLPSKVRKVLFDEREEHMVLKILQNAEEDLQRGEEVSYTIVCGPAHLSGISQLLLEFFTDITAGKCSAKIAQQFPGFIELLQQADSLEQDLDQLIVYRELPKLASLADSNLRLAELNVEAPGASIHALVILSPIIFLLMLFTVWDKYTLRFIANKEQVS